MNIKAILSDFDGTLVDNESNYDPQTAVMIKNLQSRGICFSIATGRTFNGRVETAINDLSINGIHIFNGGAIILNTISHRRLWYQPLSNKSLRIIVPYLQKAGVYFVVEKENDAFISHPIPNPPFMKGVEIKPISKLSFSDDVVKILILAYANTLTAGQADQHIKNIEYHCKDVSAMRFKIGEKVGFDITSEHATKHTATLEYIKTQGLKKDEVVAIGNDFNDYPLFTAVGYSIAMPDSPKELKEIASYVIEDGNQGIVPALKHILDMRYF